MSAPLVEMALTREERNERRREAYRLNAEEILAKKRARQKVECPICKLDICNRSYFLKVHMRRHEKKTGLSTAELLADSGS